MQLSIRNVTKSFGQAPVLRNIQLEIADHELFFLLGPSGCGKTTLLRIIAGFYQPDEGELFFGDRLINQVPPHARNTGMVFQNYALWPHLSVAENVGYGLDVRGIRGQARLERIAEALDIVQMRQYGDRSPNQLSGGQQQRVALARALVIHPDVLLLDEPLSNLDARLRLEMREEIRRIHDQTRITTIYVTHDQKESLSMADRMAVLRDGQIEQIGSPRSVYRAPTNRFVADFIGETNWLEGTVELAPLAEVKVRTAEGSFVLAGETKLAVGCPVWLGFRPEALRAGPATANALQASIVHVTYLGEIEQYVLQLPSGLRVKAFEQNPLGIRTPGSPLPWHVRSEDLFILPR